jgi:tight adherence protein B
MRDGKRLLKKGNNDSDGGKAATDYGIYVMNAAERLLYTSAAAIAIFAAAFVFYRSILISALLIPSALIYPRLKTADLAEKRRRELNIQFKDMLYSLSSSLSAGRSVEASFRDVLRDLSVMYPDPRSLIIVEVGFIIRRLEMNETIEAILQDFARRAGLEDVDNFVDVFITCKRTGGNIIEVIRNSSAIINDKIEVRQEIDTLLAQRKFERKVLNLVPILMITLLSVSAADYIGPVFTTAAGRLVMTAALLLLAAAWFISKKIADIRI